MLGLLTGMAQIQVGAGPDLFKKYWPRLVLKTFGPDVLRKEIVAKTILKSGSFKNVGPDNCGKEIVISRAPEVHLTRRLVHSACFFKTKSSSILLMLESNQIKAF